MINIKKNFKNKKVLITGHTGFKGSWLSIWLNSMEAKVLGISIDVPSKPSHFKATNLKSKIISKKVDIRNLKQTKKIIRSFKPDFIFHLAAQALVNKSYNNPIYTWETNLMGTVNILESIRGLKKKCVTVLITSDKSYKNLEIERGYNENDILGGTDQYSASKASAELAIKSYIKSYFSKNNNKHIIGVARAGNVIGGGDWSENRLIPDCTKSWLKNNKVNIRNPNSTRPWQHVLEALSGYIYLAVNLSKNKKLHGEAFNFGPNLKNNYKVISVVKLMKKYWKNVSWKIKKNNTNLKESKLLKLNSNKAKTLLNWRSILNLEETIKLVCYWYQSFNNKKENYNLSLNQIKYYEKLMIKRSK